MVVVWYGRGMVWHSMIGIWYGMGIVWHGMVGVSFCIKPGINYKMTDKHTAEYSNTANLGVYWHVCNAYIRYCSYNNVARCINILVRNAILSFNVNFYTRKNFLKWRLLKDLC